MKRPQLSTVRPARAMAGLAMLTVLLTGCAMGSAAPGNQPSGTSRPAARGTAARAGTAQSSAAQHGADRGSTTAAGRPAAAAAPDNKNAPGFWYGTDSATIPITSKPPYREPAVSGSPPYGGYIGMAGNWARWSGCGGILVWSSQNSAAANTNHSTYHKGIGTGVYWFMAGPGVDPHYTGTTAEASAWGAAQAAKTLRAIGGLKVTYKVVWMDIELPGNAPDYTPAPDNGWNNVYTSTCSGKVKTAGLPASLDRADLNGYASYLTAHSSYTPGVYSAPQIWGQIFGTGSASSIPTIDEWTYTDATSHISPPPIGWCVPGTSTCAHFFGGVTSSSAHAVMWQWSGGGGVTNGVGDFDEIDTNHVR
ncbi:MAG TPA: hypothetical protein VMH35_20795 [Streptosporangiaceae bacterium]|nr:hypothetical protein [Streptosporangiaceae bacterium]